MRYALALLFSVLAACSKAPGPPPEGWANTAPTVVEQVIDRGDQQLLLVGQGELKAWVQVPDAGAGVGDYVLLGQGTPRYEVEVPELDETVDVVVDIAHVAVVDEATAREAVSAATPPDAVAIGTVYAELDQRAGTEVVVHGTVVKATKAVGWTWVHLQDGSGDAEKGSHDLTIQTNESVVRGQRVAFRGTLRQDVDLGFGYHYDALVEDAKLLGDAAP